MPFGLWTRVGPRKHVLDEPQVPHAKGQLLGVRTCSGMPRRHSAVRCAKLPEPVGLPFGLWTWWPMEAQVLTYSTGGANVSSHEGTLAPPGEYD